MRIAVTGCSGFVGSRLLSRLKKCYVVAIGRSEVKRADSFFERSLSSQTDYSKCLRGLDCVVHTAARVHVMQDQVDDPLSEYRKINVEGTLNLARQAAAAGIKRFVFVSSIKVNGEQTQLGCPFVSEDTPAPEDAYGISKYEAESGLQKIAAETGMEVVIIRPPLVYGPGVKGNFASMTKLIMKGLPLPLGAIHNQRSLVAVDNLVDLIFTCIDHPAAANQIFLVSDDESLSTSQLLRSVAKAMSVPARLIPIPSPLLMVTATLLGKKTIAQRLLGSLQVDISKTRELLGWTPPLSIEEGLRRCFEPED